MTKIADQYNQTLEFLFSQLPMYQRKGKQAFKKDLGNIVALCDALDDPHRKFPAIHLAGTNGKGSTAHMLAAVLQTHGYKTGLYTSPHYRDFRERIKVDEKYVSRKYVVKFVKENKALLDKIKPSFFEMTVAMAFHYFAKKKVDIAIIETGLGGRLDSTNIIYPLLSVITNISLDHQDMLGPDLPSIAAEKAGIIKENVPVVVGEYQRAVADIFKTKARACNAEISFADKRYKCEFNVEDRNDFNFKVAQGQKVIFEKLLLGAGGAYQQKNLQTTLQSLDVLTKVWPGFNLDKAKLKSALENFPELTRFMGRWQKLGDEPLIIADSAHNEGGLQLVMQQLKNQKYKKMHFVLAAVKGKELAKLFQYFPKDAIYYFAKADIPRGLSTDLLEQEAGKAGLQGQSYNSVKAAFKAAKKVAGKDDLIFVGGSCFTVAEVL